MGKIAVADHDSDVVVTKVSTISSTTPSIYAQNLTCNFNIKIAGSQLSPVNNAEIHPPHVMSMH